MSELERQLARGPLRVSSVWSPEPPERAVRAILRRRRRAFALRAAAVGSCAALALVFGLRRGESPVPVSTQVVAATAPVPQRSEPQRAFADGSLAELSGEHSALVVEADTPSRVVTRLSGSARFRVTENPSRVFEVRTAEVRIRVLGTVFSVFERGAARAEVRVEQGKVEVAWLGGATTLTAGQAGTFPPETDGATALRQAALDEREADSAPPSASDARAAKARVTAAELLHQADEARLRGAPEAALAPLRQVYERYPRDRRAPVAAFTLGRVLLDDLGRAGEAASAFEKARTLWPKGPLAVDALAREAEARVRAGEAERGRRLANQYLARHPDGKHAAAMRKLLAR